MYNSQSRNSSCAKGYSLSSNGNVALMLFGTIFVQIEVLEFPLPEMDENESYNYPNQQGFCYQITAVQECIAAGLLESPEYTHAEMLQARKNAHDPCKPSPENICCIPGLPVARPLCPRFPEPVCRPFVCDSQNASVLELAAHQMGMKTVGTVGTVDGMAGDSDNTITMTIPGATHFA